MKKLYYIIYRHLLIIMKSLNLKNFHKLIINTQYNLSNSLINSLTPNLIGHDCLFEHLFSFINYG